MESSRRLAISTLPLSLATKYQIYHRGPPQLGVRRAAPLATRLLGCQTGSTPLFHFLSKIPQGFLGCDASFAACQRCLRLVQGSQELRALPLAFLPQGYGLLHCILGTMEPAGLDGVAHASFRIGRSTYFHGSSVRATHPWVKPRGRVRKMAFMSVLARFV